MSGYRGGKLPRKTPKQIFTFGILEQSHNGKEKNRFKKK